MSNDCKDLIPDYLNFIKGIVDANDIPLNISRETLQQNNIIKKISKHLIKKCFSMFDKISKDENRYLEFYKNFQKT